MTEEVIPTANTPDRAFGRMISRMSTADGRDTGRLTVFWITTNEEVYQMQVNVENNLFWVMKDEDLVDVVFVRGRLAGGRAAKVRCMA